MAHVIVYVPSERKRDQGKYSEVARRNKGCRITELGGGYGNWICYKEADVLVDGRSFRDAVLEYYNKEKLTENLVDRFRQQDLNE